MTTNLAEIKEKFFDELSYDCDGSGCMHSMIPHTNKDGTDNWELFEKIKNALSTTIDRSFQAGRDLERIELLSQIKGIMAESEGDVMVILAGLLNKLQGYGTSN